MKSFHLLILLLGICGHALANEVLITSENAETIIGKDRHVIVKYFSPNCDACTAFDPVWTEIIENYNANSDIIFAKVDCSTDVDVCKNQGLRVLPALTCFSKESTVSEMFVGKMEKENIVEFINTSIAPECTFLNLDRCNEKQRKWMDEHADIENFAVEKLINDCSSDLEKVNVAYEQHVEDVKKQSKETREKYDQYVKSKYLELKWYREIRREMETAKPPILKPSVEL